MLKKIGRIVLVSVLYYSWHIPFDMNDAGAQSVIAAERVTFEGPGGNVGAMRETTQIRKVEVDSRGVTVTADKLALPVNRGGAGWPDTCQPIDSCKEDNGRIDMGALQYSIGFVLPVNGTLYGSAPIEAWFGRVGAGTGDITDQSVTCDSGTGQIHCNLFYARDRWPNLFGSHPQPGDEIGVFVVAGDARNNYVPLGERSNIVTFRLPQPGGSTVVEYAGGGQAPANAADVLRQERERYGATINADQAAAVLNAAAWRLRGDGFALLGKAGGNNCDQPKTGTRISCDYLIQNRGGVWYGWDVLIAAPGRGEPPSAATPSGPAGEGDNMSDAINSGARTVVQAVDPGTGGGDNLCHDPAAKNNGGPLPCVYPTGGDVTKADLDMLRADLVNQIAALRQTLDALGGAVSNTNQNLADQVTAINNAIADLSKRIDAVSAPTGCKVTGGIGGFKFGLHCELTK